MKHLLLLLIVPACLCAADPIEIKLWPDGAPGQMQPHSKATEDFIRTKAGKSTITDIHDPTITVYRPEKPNGTCVVVAPGGGFVFLSAIHEGTQVCEWLNTLGVTGILLKYRTPTRDEAAPHEKPVADAAKAITLAREHAKEWNLDPTRIGLLGFSAGGNLLAHIACDRATKTALPNFGIMIYGGGFVDSKDPTKLKEGFTVPNDAPPMFLACAHDDGQNPTAATLLYLEYKKLGIPCELHLFTKGGHGFGMRDNKQPINAWPQRCAEWMKGAGLLSRIESLNSQIEDAEKRLEKISQIAQKVWICGNDLDLLKEMKAKLKVAKAKGQSEAAADLENNVAEFEASLNKATVTMESVIKDTNRIKKEKLELEAERQQLLDLQSHPKSP